MDEVPEPPHPNCKCEIEPLPDDKKNDEQCDCWEKIDEILNEVEDLDAQLSSDVAEMEAIETEVESWLSDVNFIKQKVDELSSYVRNMEPCGPNCVAITGFAVNVADPDRELESKIYSLLENIQPAREAYEIFVNNKHEMFSDANGFDKYYHAKANCEAAELGMMQAAFAVLFSIGKEVRDYWRKVHNEHQDAKKIFIDCMEDLRADYFGLIQAAKHGCCADKVKPVYDIFK